MCGNLETACKLLCTGIEERPRKPVLLILNFVNYFGHFWFVL